MLLIRVFLSLSSWARNAYSPRNLIHVFKEAAGGFSLKESAPGGQGVERKPQICSYDLLFWPFSGQIWISVQVSETGLSLLYTTHKNLGIIGFRLNFMEIVKSSYCNIMLWNRHLSGSSSADVVISTKRVCYNKNSQFLSNVSSDLEYAAPRQNWDVFTPELFGSL